MRDRLCLPLCRRKENFFVWMFDQVMEYAVIDRRVSVFYERVIRLRWWRSLTIAVYYRQIENLSINIHRGISIQTILFRIMDPGQIL